MERLPTPPGEWPDRTDDFGGAAYTAVATIDAHGIVTGWSEGARRLLGYESSQVVGHPAARLLAGASGESVRRDVSGRDRWSGSAAIRHRDGSRLRLRLLANRRVYGGRADEWLVVSAVAGRPGGSGERMPGEQLPGERPEELGEWAFAQSPCDMAVFGADLRLVRANAAMERVLGFTEAEMRGLCLPEIAPQPVSEEIDRGMRRAVETGEPQYPQAGLRPATASGPQLGRPVSLAPLKDPDGRVRAVCLATHPGAQEPPAQQHTRLLKDAGTRIGTTQDIARTAQELADATVPRLADFAVVDLLDVPGSGDEAPSALSAGGVTLRRTAVQSVLGERPESMTAAGGTTVYPALSPVNAPSP